MQKTPVADKPYGDFPGSAPRVGDLMAAMRRRLLTNRRNRAKFRPEFSRLTEKDTRVAAPMLGA